MALIRRISRGKTLLMVEHDMKVVFDLADVITVLVYGRVIASGPPPQAVRGNPLGCRAGSLSRGAGRRMMLEVRDLHAYYGQSHILHGVALDVGEGEIVSLTGYAMASAGRPPARRSWGWSPPQGTVTFKGKDMAGLRPRARIAHCRHRLCAGGPAGLSPTLTVRQNLELGLKRSGQVRPLERSTTCLTAVSQI